MQIDSPSRSLVPPARPTKELTVLVYLDGQFPDLESAAASALRDMEALGSSADINLVAELGRAPQDLAHPEGGCDGIDGDWSGVRRYLLRSPAGENAPHGLPRAPVSNTGQGDTASDAIHSPVLADLGTSARMDDPERLKDFIDWGMRSYPARHYVVLLYGHGEAWRMSMGMPVEKLAQALTDGSGVTGAPAGIDVLLMHSCLMSNIEALQAMRNTADIIVAPQTPIRATALDLWCEALSAVREQVETRHQSFDARAFVTGLVATSADRERKARAPVEATCAPDSGVIPVGCDIPTLAAVDTSKVEVVTRAWEGFVRRWQMEGGSGGGILEALQQSRASLPAGFGQDPIGLHDLGDAARRIQESPGTSRALKDDARRIEQALQQSLVAEEHEGFGMQGLTGVSFWAPASEPSFIAQAGDYQRLAGSFDAVTGYSGALQQAFARSAGQGSVHPPMLTTGVTSQKASQVGGRADCLCVDQSCEIRPRSRMWG